MAKGNNPQASKNPMSLLLVEGKTDEIFYKRIKADYLLDIRCSVRKNLQGLFGINKKVINHTINYLEQHKDEKIRIYCCLDAESRYGTTPGFDIGRIKKYFKDNKMIRVLSIDVIKATIQIESWFFYDIEGIFEFLRVPKPQRKPNEWIPPEKYGYKDLQNLFEKYDRTYNKGKRATNLIDHLNIDKITSNCKELRDGIGLIKSQADDFTNRLSHTK